MPKDDTPPAFLLYVDDFVSDGIVEAMTTEQVGAYFLLLCKAWREDPPGSIPDNDYVLARWARLTPERWAECRTGVLAAFSLGTDDRWHQKRMRKEFAKLTQRNKEKSLLAKRAATARWSGHQIRKQSRRNADASIPHMQNDAIPSSSSFSNNHHPQPPPKVATADNRPSAGLAGGGNAWDIDKEAHARLALQGSGYKRFNDLIIQCRDLGLTPDDVIHVCREYEVNRSKFESPGAIAERLRTGHWPIDGVVPADEAQEAADKRKAKSRAEAIQGLRFRLIKAGENDAREWDDSKVVSTAREKGLIS